MRDSFSCYSGSAGVLFNASSEHSEILYCTNYSSFWVVSATEKEAGGEVKRFSPNYDDNKDASITTDWLTAKSVGNILTVTIQPTTLDANRFMKVEVEAGDVFDEFNFKQRGLKVGL